MDKFEEAVSVLLLGQPFFGTLLMKMEHVKDEQIPTLCVNRHQLRYNPKFLDQLDLDESVFAVAHEVMHQAWQHLPRLEHYLKTGVGPDGHALDLEDFNRALDYPMNHALVVGKVGKPIAKEKFPICLDPQRFPESMTPEEVYCELRKDRQKNGGKGGDKGGKALDQHDAMTGADEPSAITPADVLQAANSHKMIRGEYPAGMERLLGGLRKPDVSPWRRLRNFITTNLPGHDATSWRRLQRRMIVRNIGMPGRVAQGAGRVGLVADSSGSIDDEMLNLFAGHMAAIMDDAMPREVVVYWTDSRVHSREVIKSSSALRAYLGKGALGGGGTDMTRGVKAAEDDKCDAIVVLTDGYTPFCSSAKPLLWAITSHAVTADGNGTTIHI